ncbi:MAG: PIN domain-containing protein [Halobacteriaceae archaeon]
MGQHIYLDTNLIIPYLWRSDDDQAALSRDVIQTLRGEVAGQYDKSVKIPKLVVGEAISEYLEDYFAGELERGKEPPNDRIMKELINLIEATEAELVSMKTECHRVARELHEDDRELGYNDLYIASLAILDSEATHLLSTDDDLVYSRSIERVANRRDEREHNLTVATRYGG